MTALPPGADGSEAELAYAADLLRAIIDTSPFATMAFDVEQKVVLWSAGAERLFGWSAGEVVGGPIPEGLIPPEDRASSQERIQRMLDGGVVTGELVIRRTRDGRDVEIEIHGGPVRDSRGRMIGFAGHMVDVSRLREAELDLALAGRVGATLASAVTRMRVGDSLESAAQSICDELHRLPFVDFAAVGVFTGLETVVLAASADPGIPIRAGDRLPDRRGASLREQAEQGAWAQPWDAQPGDGEWGRAMTESGLQAFAVGPLVHGRHVDGGVVIGTRDPGFARTLVGKWSGLVDFSTTPSALLAERLHAHREEHEIRAVVASIVATAAFHPVFQPIVDLATGETVGHEALTRFTSGRRPDLVFADAQAVGLGTQLELATLAAGIRDARRLPAGLWLDLNVSPWLLDDPDTLRAVLAPADRPIVLEVTEHEVIADYDAFRAAVRSLGREIRLAVDDAGAGVANFGHIVGLGSDFVKLDHSLIRGVDAHLGRQALVVGLRYFSRASSCRLVAEGVETEDEARTLVGLGVEFGQGHYFGAAVRAPGAPTRRSRTRKS